MTDAAAGRRSDAVRPISVIREDRINGGCPTHGGRLHIAVQASSWARGQRSSPAAKPMRPLTGIVGVMKSEAPVAGYRTSTAFNRVKA